MNNNERCVICGDIFTDEDVKIYCPDCGMPMHKDCFDAEGCCPNSGNHYKYASAGGSETPGMSPVRADRHFADGSGCEICGKPFEENDEKVYCPDCGAAMHRLCYSMTHKCPYADEHTPRVQAAVSAYTRIINSKPVCDRCGKELDNGEEKVYCPVCGTPVHRSCWDNYPVCPNEDKHDSGFDWEKAHEIRPVPSIDTTSRKDDFQFSDNIFDDFSDMVSKHPIRSSENGEELTCRGVSQQELVHFLGQNNISTPRFFTVFMNMANSGKVISLNLSAWFFMPLYHYYRRMTGLAIILTLASFVLMVPSLIYQLVYFSGDQVTSAVTPLMMLSNITSYIMIAVRLLLLFFNDYIYMRWSVSKILSLREQYKDAGEDEYYEALEHSGNPRMMYVLGGISLIFLLVYLLNIFIKAYGIV